MKQRIVTAAIGIPLILVAVWFDTPWFPLLILPVAAIAVLGIGEFYRLAELSGGRPLTIFGAVWALLYVVDAHLDAEYLSLSLLGTAILVPAVWLRFFSRDRDRIAVGWAWTLAGILYVGWTLGHFVALRELDDGREWTILALFTTFACDTGAFLVGRTWGRRRLAPSISPGKTWEGAVGGFVAAAAAAAMIAGLLDAAGLSLPASYPLILLLGCLIGLSAQLGDLFESLIKRTAGVKDSGRLIPGHGGLLDRIDSVVFAGVVVYYYVLLVT